MNSSLHRVTIVTILLIAFLGSHAVADKHVVETITIKKGPEGSVGRSAEIITWIGTKRFSRFDQLNNITTIVRKDLDKMYILQHDDKTAIELDIPFDLPEHLQAVFNDIEMTWEINRIPEKRKIGNWECTKVLLNGSGTLDIDLELWVTNETGIDTRAFHAMVGESLAASPIYRDLGEKLFALAANYAISTTTSIRQFGLTISTQATVRSIKEEPAPAGTYDPPSDYTVKPMDFSAYLSLVRHRQPGPGGN